MSKYEISSMTLHELRVAIREDLEALKASINNIRELVRVSAEMKRINKNF